MKVWEMEGKEAQVEVPWIPTTPAKPVVLKPVPICTPGKGNHMGHHGNGTVACGDFTPGEEKNCRTVLVANIVSDSGKVAGQRASDAVSSWSNMGCSEHLSPAEEAESANSNGTQGFNDGFRNPLIPPITHDNSRNPQGIYERTSQDAPFTLDGAHIVESRQIASMQINMEGKDLGEEENAPAKMLDNVPPTKELCDVAIEFAAVSSPFRENHNPDTGSGHDIDLHKTPQQKPRRRKHRPKVIKEEKPKQTAKRATPKPAQPKENSTGKRKYVRRKGLNTTSTPLADVTGEMMKEMPEAASVSCRRSLNFDIGTRDESSAGLENVAADLSKENGVIIQETNIGLAYDFNTSVTQASNSSMPLPEDTQAPSASSTREISRTKPKENPTGKRKYGRRGVNKTSAPLTKVTGELTKEKVPESTQASCTRSVNFGKRVRDQSTKVKEKAIVHPGNEIGVVMQEMNADLAYDLNTSMKQESNCCMSLLEDMQSPNTTSRRKRSGTKQRENPAGKRKNVRGKGVNKTSAPLTEVTRELTEERMLESAQTSCTASINFDERVGDQNSAVKQNVSAQQVNEVGVIMQEMNVGLAYDLNSSMKQDSNNYMSLPNDAKAPSTSLKINLPGEKTNKNTASKRKNVRKNGLNISPTPPTEMAELTEAMVLESNNMSWRRSLNYDIGTKDGNSAGRENLDLHIAKENIMLEETKVGLTYDRDIWMKQSLNNKMLLPEETQDPSAPVSKSNSLGAKLNANTVENKNNRKGQATAQDANISDSQVSSIRLEMVGSKRKHSDTISWPDDSSMNLIGANYNGLSSYQTNFCYHIPNIKKKRKSEKGKTSETYVTSSVTTTKEVQLTYPQVDAQEHPYASSSSCWIYGSGYNAPRLSAISESNLVNNNQTYDEFILSLRRLTERSQSRPQTGVDALVAETHAPLTKKKRNRKKSALPSSAYSSANHYFTLGNYPLPDGMSSDMAHELIWKTMNVVDALAEQFRQLNINTEARNLIIHEQNALIPYKQQSSLVQGDGIIIPFQDSFGPIKKQHPRPKVDLDDETDRVWRLLMLDINSHGIDGTDEDKAKWWEEERNVFRGRVDSFIARMHLVQGDRRFTPWKGSVVDSVVGVFLTQNVSDHLSSSAYMSLAARFPRKSSSMCNTYHAQDTRLVVSEPQVHTVETVENMVWDAKLLNQSVYDLSSMTTDIVEHSGGREVVNSNHSSGRNSSVISLTDESNSRLSESSPRNIKEQCSPMRSGPISATIEEGEEKSCFDGDMKELNEIVSSQCSVISSQTSGDFSNDQNPEKIGSCSDSNSEVEDLSCTTKYNHFDSSTSFCKLLEMVSSTKFYEHNNQKSKSIENLRDAYDQSIRKQHDNPTKSLKNLSFTQSPSEVSVFPSDEYTLKLTPNSGVPEVNCFGTFKTDASSTSFLKNKNENGMDKASFQTKPVGQVAITQYQNIVTQVHPQEQGNRMEQSFFNISGKTQDLMQKERGLAIGHHKKSVRNETKEIGSTPIKLKSKEPGKEKKDDFNWDSLRIQAQARAGKREKRENTMDSLDWDAVRRADVSEVSNTIKDRGMNNRLAERIKNFLDRLVEEHGSIDLEWLRDVPPDKAKEYLLSIRGLGLKSVECVRLLTLHHLAFPVDTNVGRIAVRLGWVPLQPLPESLQLHLLELYPVLESIQKYLWPRLCKLDQRTLYELHYQMITFGKVFCTKSKPNCNACPLRGECRHFASAFASARLSLPGPEQKSIVSIAGNSVTNQKPSEIISQLYLPPPENTNQAEEIQLAEVNRQLELKFDMNICQPIIEEPTTPEPECSQVLETDMEDTFDDSCEIPTIKLDIEEFTLNLQNYMQEKMELQEGEMSKALVALNQEAASIPMPKLKNVSRLRTEHCVYELPDSHPLLEGWDTREHDDPGKYLLAIWTPGETANSIQPPESKCSSQEESGQLCNERECFSCNSFREANSQIVRGTILIPCRTAMRGRFPLNGTYFQVNEVFADHDSSLSPISVPRSWIWNLNRLTVYFGTSIPTIFKGLSTQEIQQCFWRGYVCVRGFDRKTRAPRPLKARLHFPASKMPKTKEKTKKESSSANSQGPKSNPEPPASISNSNNLQETARLHLPASKLAKAKEKTRKQSKSVNPHGQEPNPEQPEAISSSRNLQVMERV
ncbi:hypothetical protein RJT34_24545 [Clitoria ternatea]|uniref:HhH-GPD domain-containing protein n=1 Tax=Clitoria ternatea TaxID=43366 RepID=A0AAN9FN30_CLITE